VWRQARRDGQTSWDEVGVGKGANDIEAIKDAISGLPEAEQNGTFVAIAASRFTPRTRRVETVKKELWG
jgi:hypothetical protein